jgi:signal transduction histidine kinase
MLPLLLLLVAELIATSWAIRLAIEGVDSQFEEQLRAVSRTLTEPPSFPLTGRILEQMKGLSGAEFYLSLADGQHLTTFALPVDISLPKNPEGDVELHGELYRVKTLRFPESHPNHGGQLGIFYAESQRRGAIRRAVQPLLLLGVLGGLLSVCLVLLLARQVTGRIAALQRQTRVIAAGTFHPMPLHDADDELRDLATSINEMAARLAEQQTKLSEAERLRVLAQFSGGLAHQLRNAAAGAKLALQLHLAEHPTTDREALDVALRQLARMEMNLKQFLDLGKPPTANKKPIDLVQLVQQTVELLGPQCRHAGVQVIMQLPEELPFQGDAIPLGHLIGNLLTNAIEAAGSGGEVQVKLRRANSEVELEVWDNGNGPAAEIAANLFEAFITGREQGIGLGLAVAKQATELHSGTINWDRQEGHTVFRVTLPL